MSIIESLRQPIMPDTDVLVLGLKGMEPYAGMLKAWIYEQRIILSSVVVHELYTEMNYQEIIALGELIKYFPVAVPEREVYEQAAGIRQSLRKSGKECSLADSLIAAQAIVLGAQLIATETERYQGIALNLKIV